MIETNIVRYGEVGNILNELFQILELLLVKDLTKKKCIKRKNKKSMYYSFVILYGKHLNRSIEVSLHSFLYNIFIKIIRRSGKCFKNDTVISV